MMKKLIYFGFICLLLTGCGSSLDKSYDKDVLKEKATEVVQYLDSENYDALLAMGDANMSQPSLKDKLKEAWVPHKAGLGAFQDYDTFDYGGKDGMAIVVVVANYEQHKVQFTITFDKELKLAGLFFK